MAGLWRKTDNNSEFVIITAGANNSVSSVHDRMPLVLTQNRIENWLCDDDDAKNLTRFILPELCNQAV